MYVTGNKKVDIIEDGSNARINFLLDQCELKFHNFDLEAIYWLVRSLRRNILKKVSKTEATKLNTDMGELTKLRSAFLKNRKKDKDGKFYIALENYYITINNNIASKGGYSESDLDDGAEEVADVDAK
jgi:hypothetical protein